MKTAVVTGTSSGIGKAVAEELLVMGYRVIGIARREAALGANYLHFQCDLGDEKVIPEMIERITTESPAIEVLVHAAGLGRFGPHEELSFLEISAMVGVNFLAPLLLTAALLRQLKISKGHIFTIGSFSSLEASSHGAVYAATKAGISSFSRSLFDETRRAGVRVTTIVPDVTATPFYDGNWFEPDDAPDTFLTPQCIAGVVRQVLMQRDGTVLTEVVLRPARFALKKRAKTKRPV